MLITLGVIHGQSVDFTMVIAFTLGVLIIFVGFGIIISYINANLLTNKKNIRAIFTATGVISLLVGFNMLLG
jgi:cytochrome c biogenesis protein CcdA